MICCWLSNCWLFCIVEKGYCLRDRVSHCWEIGMFFFSGGVVPGNWILDVFKFLYEVVCWWFWSTKTHLWWLDEGRICLVVGQSTSCCNESNLCFSSFIEIQVSSSQAYVWSREGSNTLFLYSTILSCIHLLLVDFSTWACLNHGWNWIFVELVIFFIWALLNWLFSTSFSLSRRFDLLSAVFETDGFCWTECILQWVLELGSSWSLCYLHVWVTHLTVCFGCGSLMVFISSGSVFQETNSKESEIDGAIMHWGCCHFWGCLWFSWVLIGLLNR